MIEGEIMGDLWHISYRFLDILGPDHCNIHRKQWGTHTLAIYKPGDDVVGDGDMYPSSGSTISLRGSTCVKEVGNSLRGCSRPPSVGYMRHNITVWP